MAQKATIGNKFLRGQYRHRTLDYVGVDDPSADESGYKVGQWETKESSTKDLPDVGFTYGDGRKTGEVADVKEINKWKEYECD